MLSLQKWSRLTGQRQPNFTTDQPDDLLVVGSDVSRMFPPVHGVVGPNSFLDAWVTVDPPVGGLAANGILGNFPNLSGDVGTIAAIVGQDSSSFFLPGVYSMVFEIHNTVSPTPQKGFIFNIMPATAAPGGQVVFPWGGAGGGILIKCPVYCMGASAVVQTQLARHRLYIPVPWFIRMDVGKTALVDADVFEVHVTVDNEYTLDEPGSMSY